MKFVGKLYSECKKLTWNQSVVYHSFAVFFRVVLENVLRDVDLSCKLFKWNKIPGAKKWDLSVSETLYRLEVIIVRLTVNLSTKTQTPVVRRRHNQINMKSLSVSHLTDNGREASFSPLAKNFWFYAVSLRKVFKEVECWITLLKVQRTTTTLKRK